MSIRPQGFLDMLKAIFGGLSDPRLGLPPRPATKDEIRRIVREELDHARNTTRQENK